jgi:hypothetical protein
MLPLEGITVVSLEQAVAAPFATRQLADLGARVIELFVPHLNLDGEVPPPVRLRHPAEERDEERVRVGSLVVERYSVPDPDGAAAVPRGRQRPRPEHDALGGRVAGGDALRKEL